MASLQQGTTLQMSLLVSTVLLAVLVSGCGNPVNHKVSDRIAAILPKTLGPAKSYEVQTTGTSLHLTNGHIGEVSIQGEDVQLAPGLVVDSFDADVRDISFDDRSQSVTGMGPIRFRTGISAINLNNYLAATAAGAPSRPQHLAVSMEDQSLAISFTVRPLVVDVPVSVVGMLAPRDDQPTKLDFVPSGGHVSIVPVPAGLVNIALSHVNPVVDLSTMRYPITIQRTWIENGQLYLSGTANIPPSSFSH